MRALAHPTAVKKSKRRKNKKAKRAHSRSRGQLGGIDLEIGSADVPHQSQSLYLGYPLVFWCLCAGIFFYVLLFLFGVTYTHLQDRSIDSVQSHSLFDHFLARVKFKNQVVPDYHAKKESTVDGFVTMESNEDSLESNEDSGVTAVPLPAASDTRNGWSRIYDPKTEKFYYHKLGSDHVQWEAPVAWDIATLSSPNSSSSIEPSPVVHQAESADDSRYCGWDFGLSELWEKAQTDFAEEKKESKLWLRVVIISHGQAHENEDVLRLTRAIMMDITATSESPYRNSVDVVVVNLAGDSIHGAGLHNPGFVAARDEAQRLHTDHFTSILRFFDAGFNVLGSCGHSARRDFDVALMIAHLAGPAEYTLLLEPGQSLCPSALLLLFYAVQKSQDYDPEWSSLRIGVGQRGYGGLIFRQPSLHKVVQGVIGESPDSNVKRFFEREKQGDSAFYTDNERFKSDLLGWIRSERKRSEIRSGLTLPLPIGGAFTYRYTLVGNSFAGTECGKSLQLGQDFRDLEFNADKQCQDNDISPCLASEEDAWLKYEPSHSHTVIPSDIALTIAAAGQSCSHACKALIPPSGVTGQYICVPAARAGRHFSDCSTIRGRFPCPGGCTAINTAQNNYPTPSTVVKQQIYVDGVPIERGTCLMGVSGSMGQCESANNDVSRLCPCQHESHKRTEDSVKPGAVDNIQASAEKIVSGSVGASCTATCSLHDMKCFAGGLKSLNWCGSLMKAFGCEGGCVDNEGEDQPAYEVSTKRCLIKRDTVQFSCEGSYATTRRLCYCYSK